jgi:hypothetical protein
VVVPLSWSVTRPAATDYCPARCDAALGASQGGRQSVSTNGARRQGPPRAAQGRQRRPRPLPPGNTLFTPDASPARASMEQRSATPLLWLHQLPAWLLPVLAVVLLVTGLAVPGWGGAIALCGLAGLLGWLAAVSWPRLSPLGRLLRIAAAAAIFIAAILRGLH